MVLEQHERRPVPVGEFAPDMLCGLGDRASGPGFGHDREAARGSVAAVHPRETNICVGKDTGGLALELLADVLGAEVIATGPVDSPLPVTGRSSGGGSPTTVHGPRGRPLYDRCRGGRTKRPAKTAKDADKRRRNNDPIDS